MYFLVLVIKDLNIQLGNRGSFAFTYRAKRVLIFRTCHLAGELLAHLCHGQPELNITPRDVLCVQMAALCHDLG
jgi:hypothetical protein